MSDSVQEKTMTFSKYCSLAKYAKSVLSRCTNMMAVIRRGRTKYATILLKIKTIMGILMYVLLIYNPIYNPLCI